MANVRITDLPEATELGESDVLHVVQGGIDKQISAEDAVLGTIEQNTNRTASLQNEGICFPVINGITNYEDSAGVYHKNLGCVDLGTLTWNYSSSDALFYSDSLNGICKPQPDTSKLTNLYCARYDNVPYVSCASTDKSICTVNDSARLVVHDSSYSDASSLKSALSGVLLFFELQNPQTWNSRVAKHVDEVLFTFNGTKFVTSSALNIDNQLSVVVRDSNSGSLYLMWYSTVDKCFYLGTTLSGSAPTTSTNVACLLPVKP